MKWTTSRPHLRNVRAAVRKHKRIGADVLQVGRFKAEQRLIDGAFKCFKAAHPETWTDPEMMGSLLKRMRNQELPT